MKQIKTVANKNPEIFDMDVNEALAEGWELVKRYRANDTHFIAELEREEITEAERCCENCAHYEKGVMQEPCRSCGDDADKWEPAT